MKQAVKKTFRMSGDAQTLQHLTHLFYALKASGRLKHRALANHFRHMLDLGFEDEVRRLWARGDLTAEMPSMRCVGYRQMLKYLFGEYTLDTMVQRGIVATRQLAKRQYTWLRAEAHCHWLLDDEWPMQRARRLLAAAGL